MSRGLNILSSGVEASFPQAVSDMLAKRVDDHARQNGVTFTGTGFQDGLRISLLQVLSGVAVTIDKISHYSLVDLGLHGPAAERTGGAGLTADEFSRQFAFGDSGSVPAYQIFIHQTAIALGLQIESIVCHIEPLYSDADCAGESDAPFKTIGARWATRIRSSEGIELEAINDLRRLATGEEEYMEWVIEGPSPIHARMTKFHTAIGTATQIVNRIGDVLTAKPGLVTIDEMRPISRLTAS